MGDGVNYAGWNRQTGEPSDDWSYIVHHPRGADMRFTRTRNVKTYTWNSSYWKANYSSGVVARGSSGAALFNEYGQVVGQLFKGASSCNLTDFGDRYGKLSSSWANA